MLLAVMQAMHDGFSGSKYRPSPLFREMVAVRCLGRKPGGVYRYCLCGTRILLTAIHRD